MIAARIYDETVCRLGEGPLWHPEREQLFWFDILESTLLTREGDETRRLPAPEMVSAAGWVDRDTLFVAGETGIWRLDIPSCRFDRLAELEADNPVTRSNDGRADPVGGFWIGTMGKQAEPGAGAIYRYFRGEIRKLFQDLTIPNTICFSPDGLTAYFADTHLGVVWRQPIDRAGWPSGKPEVFADFSGVGLAPDGAVCDAEGNLWIAQWGAWRVACHGPDGSFRRALSCGAAHTTCPAFGGPDLTRMFVTSATQGVPVESLANQPGAGRTWVADLGVAGQPEHRVVLP
ncbi:SMP-30/gluconolactonase/LRE family protein [Jannaschia seohaensis]|uniref:Sugar lactone lactonase YvrE n=1 Tax=Jannaschia seohaensis TaxID=475081 RepID=A0A2Y9B1N5_9RHOB|nr:SMP-30/gluconolactonase/LRE family protein [Jannaschia seohaensis]PWJ15096.1 sugar lactone lactonase YvrE [Jannaschia seohaensis]SSA49945.1 Sugar lactone lactonase YvrE [Jannaschia seohaensis]